MCAFMCIRVHLCICACIYVYACALLYSTITATVWKNQIQSDVCLLSFHKDFIHIYIYTQSTPSPWFSKRLFYSYQIELLDIQTACGYRSCYEKLDIAILEILDITITILLINTAVK